MAININFNNVEWTDEFNVMDKQDILDKVDKYQVKFFEYYSEYYMDDLSWLTHMWPLIRLHLLVEMGATLTKAKPEDVIIGKLYRQDLNIRYGDFLSG